MLEIGCYTGIFLEIMKKQGWRVEGVEPNVEAARLASDKLGKPIPTDMIETVVPPKKPEELYDLVAMGGVLEHLNAPVSALMSVNRLLKQGGKLFLRLPNVERLILDTVGDIFTLEHPNMFSVDTLQLLFARTGFVSLRVSHHAQWPRHIICLAQKEAAYAAPLPARPVDGIYERVASKVKAYGEFQEAERDKVRRRLHHLWSPVSRAVLIYGAGNHTEFLLRHTNIEQAKILGISDSNPAKWGSELFGYHVVPPEQIEELKPDAVVISTRAFQEDVYTALRWLEGKGIEIVRLYDLTNSDTLG
jgi:SAM-dependent methyltransferase